MRMFCLLLALVLTPVLSHAADASIDSTAALKKARSLRPYVSENQPALLWAQFAPSMKDAMGDSTRFAAALDGIHAQVGKILEVTQEDLLQDHGVWVYRAFCKFENTDDPLMLMIALSSEGKIAGLAVRPQPKEYASTKLDYVNKTLLQLPFRGQWYVVWGGNTIAENYHATSKSQRFALDLVIRKGGSSYAGDGKKLTDYYCFGADILAPAAGRIVWSCDSLPNQQPGRMDSKNPVGNGIIIDHGNGEFSVLAHLQPNTQRFKVGDSVKAGDVLGKCGSSGNTSEPHLHFHLQNSPDLETAEGLPITFRGICVDGKKVETAQPVRRQSIKRCP